MNTNFLAKSAVLATAATMRARTQSGSSPAKDDAANGNGNDANGNGNGTHAADADSGKATKKKKKNKKRNSRSSLTAEDSVNAVDGEEEEDVEESLSSAPSPVVATNATVAPSPPAVEVADATPFAWNEPAKPDASLLDLPSPAPVSSGSPFDVFDTLDASDATSTSSASAVVMPPTTPVADAASAAPPAVDLAELFGSPSPVEAPVNRAPPPPPPAPVAETERVVFTAPATAQAQLSPPSPTLPPQATRAEPELFDVQTPVSATHAEVESPVPTTAEGVEASGAHLSSKQGPSEPAAPNYLGSNAIEASDVQLPAPVPICESISPPEERSVAPESPLAEHTVPQSSEVSTTTTTLHSDIAAKATTATVTEDIGLAGDSVDEVELQEHADTTFEAELAALAASPSPPTALPTENVQTAQVVSELPPPPQAPSAPPAPVGAKTSVSQSPSASTRSTKPSTNGESTPESKAAVTKSLGPTKRASGTGSTTTPTTRAVHKTAAPRTPTKQVPKPSTASPSATAPVVSKPAVVTTPTFQRSLSGPAGVKKAARSPTNGNTSPTPAHSGSSDHDPKVVKKKLSASEIDAAGNRLYEQAMESKRRLEAKKALREEEFTFTPQVNAKSKKMDNADAPNRFIMLHERAKEAQRKKEELREKLEKEECTFKPQITNKAKKTASTSDKPRFENLYRNALEIQAKREEKKKQEQEKNEEELTFKPKIKTTKSPVRSRPLYDPEVVKQKRLELEQKKMEAEQQAKPKVVRKTKTADGDNKIFDRLYQAGQQRAERLAKLKQEREDQEKANATFQPKVSSSAASSKSSSQPFHQRLYDKDYLKKVAAEREQKKIEEEKKRFSFKPRVSDMPDSVKSKGSSEGGSTGKSTIFERLYQDKDRVKEKIELSEELKIQKEMEECTFRPQIDPPPTTSSKGEATTPIWERLLSIDKNQIADERERMKAQLELEACTFRPEISPTPGSVSPKRASSHDIFERLSTSAGNTPVDENKRRPSERKSIASVGKRTSYNEPGPVKAQNGQRQALSVGDILKSSKLVVVDDAAAPQIAPSTSKTLNGSFDAATVDPTDNVARSLDMELSEPDVLNQSKSILENYDTWAAGLEEKMRNM